MQASEIALAGHSDGATAVGMLAYDRGNGPLGVPYASLRAGITYRAVMILSGIQDTAQPYAADASRPNLLVIASLDDRCVPFREMTGLYYAIHQPNKWFLELRTAHHLPPFDGADAPAFKAVVATSIRFLQISLQGATPSTSLLDFGNEGPSIARMFRSQPGPGLRTTSNLVQNCGPT